MRKFENDKQLRDIIKKTQLESPGENFTANVMNAVYTEIEFKGQKDSARFLGKNFWIFVSLFAAIFIFILVLPSGGQSGFSISNLLPFLQSDVSSTGFSRIMDSLTTLPVGISGILFGISLLLFIEKYLSGALIRQFRI